MLALLAAPPAFADLFVGPNCQFKTIQAAIDAVQPGFNIGVVPGTYYELLHVNSKKDLLIFGGWTIGCGAGSSGPTIVSGAHNSGDSVVTTSGENYLTLADLTISDGNENSDGGHGGGIDFGGHGALFLDAVVLQNNFADYGGGLDVTPDGPTEVQLLRNTMIEGNRAGRDGGGIHIDGPTRLFIVKSQTLIFNNEAQRNGGGIDITGPARADIGSPGFDFIGTLPVIYQNTAQNGGGISAVANTEDNQPAVVRLFTTDAHKPVEIRGNTANGLGGGVYLKGFSAFGGANASAALCAYDFRIDGNAAADGTAVYADVDYSFDGLPRAGTIYLNRPGAGSDYDCNPDATAIYGGKACAAGVACNEIAGNGALDPLGAPTDGATILLQDGAYLYGDRFTLRNNIGGRVLRKLAGSSNIGTAFVNNCLVADNQVTHELISTDDPNSMSLSSCTFAHDTIGADHVMHGVTGFEIEDSIIAESGKLAIDYSGPADGLFVQYVVSNDISTLPISPKVIAAADPQFVNAVAGDYHLQPTSPALDLAPAMSRSFDDVTDLDGKPRVIDLSGVPDLFGPRDVGAFELQSLPACAARDTIFCNGFGG